MSTSKFFERLTKLHEPVEPVEPVEAKHTLSAKIVYSNHGSDLVTHSCPLYHVAHRTAK